VISLTIVAAVDDLFFAARIRETARQAGVTVEIVEVAQFEAAWAGRQDKNGVASVIVDLSSPGAVDLIRRLKHDPQNEPVRIVSFVSHVASDLISAARNAGCDQVMARSAFTRELPDLLRRLSAGPSKDPAAMNN
jgi:DNA-binding NarL/FixJ family response regulator